MEGDLSMDYARQLGQGLAQGRAIALPRNLQDVQKRAAFVNDINDLLMGSDPAVALRALGQRIRYLAEASVPMMPQVSDPLDRVSIALRLWGGCLAAAKTIAEGTLSGMNMPAERARAFFR